MTDLITVTPAKLGASLHVQTKFKLSNLFGSKAFARRHYVLCHAPPPQRGEPARRHADPIHLTAAPMPPTSARLTAPPRHDAGRSSSRTARRSTATHAPRPYLPSPTPYSPSSPYPPSSSCRADRARADCLRRPNPPDSLHGSQIPRT